MKKLFVLALMAALIAGALSACSMTGVTRNTTTATEKPAVTEAPTAEPAAEATVEPAEATVEPAAEPTVETTTATEKPAGN